MKNEKLKIKNGLRAAAFCILHFAFCIGCSAANPTPFVFYVVDQNGVATNCPVTIKGFATTNEIIGVSTNIVAAGFVKTYTPTSGMISNVLMPGCYKLYIPAMDRATTFCITETNVVQNLAQLAGFPVALFMNYTLAQFSDAGTAAYSNAAAFLPYNLTNWTLGSITNAGNIGYSNATAFAPGHTSNPQGYARLSGTNTWTGTNIHNEVNHLTNAANVLGGDGAAITALDASSVTAGSLPDARLSNNVARLWGTNTWTGTNNFNNFGTASNGIWWNGVLYAPVMTNGINYGNAFSSPGSGVNSEQFGNNASAAGPDSLAVGSFAFALAQDAIGIGSGAEADGENDVAVGSGALAAGTNSIAIGTAAQVFTTNVNGIAIGSQANVSAANATALGTTAVADQLNSTAIGYGADTTAPNQIMLGGSGINAVVQNNLSVGGGAAFGGALTNVTVSGTNKFPAEADISFARRANSSLANGVNAGVLLGTNVFMEVSGPSAAFTIAGLDGAPNRDGKLAIIFNQTGFAMTLAHQSGGDPTAANRIISPSGADRVTTGNGAAVLIYSGAASRWILLSFDP